MREIKTELIAPHPKNPRKDLGDLTELTDSIRTFGVLQNLTVVPDGTGGYIVLCGHRRLAAAEAAGLETVPCIVADNIDEKTQVSIMLLENMQRSDLTVQEEAQGFQMMLDLGSSIAEIVKETGLSETKVRHRIKMNELDQDILTEKLAGQVSINDLIALEQIKDIDKRNEVLEEIGTNNFEWKLKAVVRDEKIRETTDLIKKLYPEAQFAEGYSWNYNYAKATCKAGSAKEKVVDFINALIDEEEDRGQKAQIMAAEEFKICFERVNERAEETEDQRRRREEKNRKNESLNEMKNRMLSLWDSFMTEYCSKSEGHIRKSEELILNAAIEGLMTHSYWDADNAVEILGMSPDDIAGMQERPWAMLAAIAYKISSPNRYETTWDYTNHRYDPDDAVSFIKTAEFLAALGYKVSDDEDAFIHGTSELYS